MSREQFDFGENWKEFSANALDGVHLAQAREEFQQLVRQSGVEISGKSFLDIGFGQGLSLLSAAALGAQVVGCDINPKCAEVLARNRAQYFHGINDQEIPVFVGSILDQRVVDRLKSVSPDGAGYQFVHSWGVLHHTGDMWTAIDHAAQLVAPGGALILALYNRHWSSPLWVPIKRLYCAAPKFVQRLMIGIFYPVILIAKALVTRRNPFAMERGMDFYFNVIDWVGGYPYEYASLGEVSRYLANSGFKVRWETEAKVPTGCNEQVFVQVARIETEAENTSSEPVRQHV